ncbi:MAG: hypothetical protein MJE66_07300 [Proteobacteria bacterium]|nr:hypothetical protein [Pseudomonadota bacterium]
MRFAEARTAVLTHSLAVALALPLLAVAARAQPPGEALTPLALELTEIVDKALALARTAKSQDTALQQRTRDAAVSAMERVRRMAVEYRERVGQSQSIAETELFFGSLSEAVASAREIAGDAVPAPGVAVELDRLGAVIARLSDVYAKSH